MINDAQWFFGKVEDIADPKQLGRVKVRIYGIHSEQTTPNLETGEGIETEALPWALPMQPITSGALVGVGTSPTGLKVGSQVVGFSRDGDKYNNLIITGTVAGIADEHDVNELARGITTDMVSAKKSGVKSGVSNANGKGTWSEPATQYAAKYPDNHVTETESGIIIELDDTSGSERVHIYHPTGTFHEIHPDGTMVTKGVNGSYEVIQNDKNISVGGSININVSSNCTIKAGADCDIQASGNTKVVTTDCDINASGNIKATAGGSANISAGSSAEVSADGSVSVSAGGSATITASSSATLKASGGVLIKGSKVELKGTQTVVI